MVRKATAADIAREAGVSMMTVSRVINHKGDVSATTLQRVQEVIDRLNYRPSGIARSLATKHTGTLGLVVPDVSNPFFADVVRGAEHIAYAEGYNIFLCNTEEDPERELTVIRSLEEKRVDGVVLFSRLQSGHLSNALSHLSTVVLINRRLHTDHSTAGTVRLDDVAGGQLAVSHLLNRGHQAIGFLAGPTTSYSGRARSKGYQQALLAAGISYDPAWKYHCLPTVEGGQTAARALMQAQPQVTAIFCFNDLVAIGAIQACVELGRRVPEEMSIVGYDDIPLAALVTPSLTTCRAPRYELGAQAVRLLLKQIRNVSKTGEEIVLQTQLVIRASAPSRGFYP
jgi:LacI family transcriptional regulator